jgi:hypothetical protein
MRLGELGIFEKDNDLIGIRASDFPACDITIPRTVSAPLSYIPEERCETNKRTPWPLVHKGTIPTERPPLVDEI